MKGLRRFLCRLRSLATSRQDEERLRAEIEEHLALETAANLRAGLPAQEARRQAALKFGCVEAIKESYREQRGLPFMQTPIQDLRLALRRLAMAPAFTLAVVATLALGIGATTSIFTLAHAVLLKSLPVAKPDELYRVGKESRCCFWSTWSQKDEWSLVSYDLYTYLRDHVRGFAELAAFGAGEDTFGVRRKGSAEAAGSYPGEHVSGNYFSMFGVRPFAGRALAPADDQKGAAPVAMMSYRLWEERYALDPSVIGGVFNLNDKPYTVVGITPPGFYGDQLRDPPPDFFLPLHDDEADVATPNQYWLDLIGRSRPGVSAASLEGEMRTGLKQWLGAHWSEMNPNERALFPQQTLYVRPGGAGITSMREQYEHWLRILMLTTGFVLLIVCANVANLMLVRGMERRRQTSLCMALGAQGPRMVRQALTESVLLALVGGAAGLGLAFAGTRVILAAAFPARAGLAAVPIAASPSLPVLLFVCAVSLLTGIAFGFGPAWMSTRTDPAEALRGAGRATAHTGSLSRRALVAIQTALSLALLSAAGLLTATLHRLENQDFGFAQDRRLVVNTDPQQAGYTDERLSALYRRIHDSLTAVPGVSAVALSIYSPLGNNYWGALVRVPGRAPAGPGEDERDAAAWNRATAGYFDVIGEQIVRGRGITEQDTETSRRVAVVNEAFARNFFGNEDPVGRHFGQFPYPDSQYEIVGVARDARFSPFGLDKPIFPFFVLPETQHDYFHLPGGKDVEQHGSHRMQDIVIELRPGISQPPAQIDAQIRQAMASVDPNLPILAIRTMKEQVSGQFIQQRLIARLSSLFGILSLVLASIGLYGVMAYNVNRRTAEIGVRMAVGASVGVIVGLVLRGALLLTLAGLLIGLPMALAAGRFLGSQLYGLSPYDPAVLSAAVATLALSALAAALIPALRAGTTSPMEALRSD